MMTRAELAAAMDRFLAGLAGGARRVGWRALGLPHKNHKPPSGRARGSHPYRYARKGLRP